MSLAADINGLRAQRAHLEAQVERGVDTSRGTAEAARLELEGVLTALTGLEDEARALPELSYLFKRGRVRKAGSTTKSVVSDQTTKAKEEGMARKSKAALLEETLEALRKAEKSAGSVKWSLSGAGAAKNPPSKERKAALQAKLDGLQATIAELRAKRDELRA